MGNFAENLNLGNRFRPPPGQNVIFLRQFVACLHIDHFHKGKRRLKSFHYDNTAFVTYCIW